MQHKTLVIPDMGSDPELAQNPVCKDFGCRFYAASPLVTADGVALGTFCVMDTDSNDRFDAASEAILELMADTVMAQLTLAHVEHRRDAFQEHVLANISHELRTPLHGIAGLCDTFNADGLATPQQLEVVNEVRGEARAMVSLVNDLIDITRLEAGQLTLSRTQFSLRDLFTDLRAILSKAASDSQVLLHLHDPYEQSPSSASASALLCEGDVGRLRQLILNLILNAIKFSSADHAVEVRVRHLLHCPLALTPSNPTYHYHQPVITRSPPSGPDTFYLYVTVADAGCGIPAERLSHMFNSFSQGDQAELARRFDGAGLGLGLSRKLIELMGGLMMVESREGDGSVFHALLPLTWALGDGAGREALAAYEPPLAKTLRPAGIASPARRDNRRLTNFNHTQGADARSSSLLANHRIDVLPATPTTSTRTVSAAMPRGGAAALAVLPSSPTRAYTILIVDDNAVNLKVASHMFHGKDYATLCASGGYAALDLVQSQAVDVVIMDLQMPDMDGAECTRRIRTLEKAGLLHSSKWRLPIIALTASAGADVERLCKSVGMDGCMFKPCSRDELRSAIADAIRMRVALTTGVPA